MTSFRFFTPSPRLVGVLSGLSLEPVDGSDRYEMLGDGILSVFSGDDDCAAIIKKGFRSDYASIPHWGRWAIPKKHNDYAHATVTHDWLYSHQEKCRTMAKELGYDNPRLFADQLMLVMANPKSWRAPVMYWALRWFGAKYWAGYRD